MTVNQKISLAIIGSTHRTVTCAQVLIDHPQFDISWVLTPAPRPVGREQIITPNPVHQFAQLRQIPIIQVRMTIDQQILEQIKLFPPVDLILVVDFGYILPEWLLKIPEIAPLNIHPSELPRWRGSSPGQFVLLFGDTKSAVTLMKINEKVDQGEIVNQIPFVVDQTWTQNEYYQHSFELISAQLAQMIISFCQNPAQTQSQPSASATPIANRISKQDAFLEWSVIQAAMSGKMINQKVSSHLLNLAYQHHRFWTETIEHATRAFAPWPNLWTLVNTAKGPKRMKILESTISQQKLVLIQVQIEGQQPASFNQIKNVIQ